jgi:hypothetical protein
LPVSLSATWPFHGQGDSDMAGKQTVAMNKVTAKALSTLKFS